MSSMTPLECQKDLFQLENNLVYLDGARMSPQLKSVESAGLYALSRKNTPTNLRLEDFFEPIQQLKSSFSKLIGCEDVDRVALIPSASYGLANAANNVTLNADETILIAADQFPSNYYIWQRRSQDTGATLQIVQKPKRENDSWSQAIIDAITENTKVISISHVHWMDGSLWDLKKISTRCKETETLLIIDGTQSVGALPFYIKEIQPDALITAGYKWMMGPYSTGYAYYGEAFDNGRPIEENWINRRDSHDFRNLIHYQESYRPKASRYCMGEQSNFIMTPMMQTALDQLIAWTPERIQDYCQFLWRHIEDDLRDIGIHLPERRAQHLVGIRLPSHIDMEFLQSEFSKQNISVSVRGEYIRVSPHLYNTLEDMKSLLSAIKSSVLHM